MNVRLPTVLAAALVLFYSGQASAALLTPNQTHALLLEAGAPQLTLGYSFDQGEHGPQLLLGYALATGLLRADIQGNFRGPDLGPMVLRLVGSLGPMLEPVAGLPLGAHIGLAAVLDAAWGPLALYAGPGLELAAMLERAQQVESRSLIYAAAGVGIRGPRASLWLTGQGGYALDLLSAGGVSGRYSLIVVVPLR